MMRISENLLEDLGRVNYFQRRSVISNIPQKLVAIPDEGFARRGLFKLGLNSLRLPDSHDLAHLLSTIANLDLGESQCEAGDTEGESKLTSYW